MQEQLVAAVPAEALGQGMGLAGSGMMTAQAARAAAVGGVAQLTNPGGAMSVAAIGSLAASVVLLWPSGAVRSAEPRSDVSRP